MPKPLQEENTLSKWCGIFIHTIERDIPENALPADKKDWPNNVWIKAKKWAYRIFEKMFSR
jgi:hypothetical protein